MRATLFCGRGPWRRYGLRSVRLRCVLLRPAFMLLAAFALFAPGAWAQRLPSLPAPLPAPATPPAAASGVAARDLLPALIEHSRSRLQIQDGRLTGPGLTRLRELAGAASFVLLGEDHGNAGIADFATALWHELHGLGWRHAAIEADPWITAEMEARLRQGAAAWAAWVGEQGGGVAPFYTWDAEARFAQAVVDAAQQAGLTAPVLWGLDQVFLGTAPWLLDRMAQSLRGTPAQAPAAALAARLRRVPLGLLGATPAELQALRAAVQAVGAPAAEALALADALILSHRIYVPNAGGEGEPQIANSERETLMKRSFAAQLAAAQARDGRLPKVMLKFGAYHLYRGASPVQVQALGGFVSELAVLHGTQVLSLLVLCPPGGEVLRYDGGRAPCNRERYGGDWAFIEPFLDPAAVTVFDLRSWRLRARRWAHLPVEVQRAVGSYDLLVFPPRRGAVAHLPGVKPPPAP